MKMSPVITPDGEAVFTAGGEHAWKVHQHRGWVVSLEWVGDHRRARKCMVIWPQTHVLASPTAKPGMWVISDRAITEFVGFNRDNKCTGSVSEHCHREAKLALPMLGKSPTDTHALNALIDCVVRFAPDLVHMPVAPLAVRRELRGPAMWDLALKDMSSGKTLREGHA